MIDEELIGEREHAEIIRKLDVYEKEAKSRLDCQVRTFIASEYSQVFLENLIPGARRKEMSCIRCGRGDLPVRIDGQCEACYQFLREEV
jgi:hypothetical protein